MRTLRLLSGFVMLGLLVSLGAGCASDSLTGPPPSLEVTTFTGGASLDANGYIVRVDGQELGRVGIYASAELSPSPAPGEHEVELSDLAANCQSDLNPRTVSVARSGTTRIVFKVECSYVSRELAFTTRRDGNEEIYATDASGSDPVRLTLYPGADRDPAWAPDGSRLAFTRSRPNADPAIYLMDAGGSDTLPLMTGENASWSPDGTRMAYVIEDSWDLTAHVFVAYADGSNRLDLTRSLEYGLSAGSPAWSPDGARIAYVVVQDTGSWGDGEEPEIWTVTADGSNPVDLWPGRDPAWSPDGTRIAFAYELDGNSSIWTMGADGSNAQPLTDQVGYDVEPAWSPDGTRIAFASTRNGNTDIYVVGVAGGDPVRVTRDPAGDRAPAWLPGP